MKPVLFVFALFILSASNSFSQDSLQVTTYLMAETITNRIDRETQLTAKQREKVYQLLLERSEGYHQANVKHKSSSSKSRAEKAKIDEKSHIKFKKILTNEQFHKYEELKSKNKEQVQSLRINQSYLTAQDEELDF